MEVRALANSINQGDLTANLDHFDTIRRPDFGYRMPKPRTYGGNFGNCPQTLLTNWNVYVQ
jgi:hypothetical protein